MIAYVEGVLKRIEENSVVIDTAGFGIRVFTPINEALLRIGIDRHLLLHTYFAVREDAMQLFGFLDPESLDLFKLLINVNGIGPKNALAILTALGTGDILYAIAQGNYKALTRVSGIGTKTAQRIIVDLKDKVAPRAPEQEDAVDIQPIGQELAGGSVLTDAVLALEALGYTHSQALDAIRKVPEAEAYTDLQALIREGLKQLALL